MLLTSIYKNFITTLCISLIVFVAGYASAAPLILSDIPLFLKEDLPPNIILSVDNSTSMRRASIYDSGISCSSDTDQSHPCYVSSTFNKQYYDPLITYLPPRKPNGSFEPQASFTNAWIDGFNQDGGTINLELGYQPTFELFIEEDPDDTFHSVISSIINGTRIETIRNFSRAYYFTFDETVTGCSGVSSFNASNENCFTLVDVSTANSGPNGEDERQNFANWYSYHRTRLLAVKSAIATSFSELSGSTRVAWQDLHFVSLGENSFSAANNNFVQPFNSSHKTDFYTWLHELPIQAGTPLITALDAVGYYMGTTDKYNPFALNPGTGSDDLNQRNDLSCRTNYHALFSDGAWNDGGSSVTTEDKDGRNQTLGDGTAYTPRFPYQSPSRRFLSDRAFEYWYTDLRSDLANNITPFMPIDTGDADADYWNPENNPATWQHLVNFTVTLGVNGNLDFPDDLDDLKSGVKIWGTNSSSKGDRIDDNWHAAINSRGAYFAANQPSELEAAFTEILNRVTEQSGSSASAVTTDSTQAATTNTLFQAKFDSKNWTGTLTAFDFQNLVKGNVQFEAGCLLTGGPCPTAQSSSVIARDPDSRLIITTDDGDAIPFRYDSLSSETQGLIDSSATIAEDIVDYMRGVRSNEESDNGTGTLRKRTSVLGDIIHSSPVLVKFPKREFPDRDQWIDNGGNQTGTLPENQPDAQRYSEFLSSVSTRQGSLFVGANDGMLHAFNAITGIEEYAYLPGGFLGEISQLTEPDYLHRYFVDGSPIAGEAFYASTWHSIVVGQMRGGGQMVYAIDATTEITATDTEADIAEKFLWEFSHPDLGYGFGEPIIARLHNNRWAAIFGNGLNNTEADGNASTTGFASLFIVDIETGDLIRQINTGVGSLETPNGITGVTAANLDYDDIDDIVYAGDLRGNVWKFDLSSALAAEWGVAYVDDNDTPIPLFSADNNQAITAKPSFIQFGDGAMVIFGTGKYLESSDNSDTSVVNSYYGVRDYSAGELTGGTLTRSDLTPRLLITAEDTNDPDLGLRRLEGEDVVYLNEDARARQGWYFDFPAGELQITKASQFDLDLTLFTTFVPNDDPCPGDNANLGTSWLYVFDTLQGKSPEFNVIDTDGNNNFDDDALADDNFASGIELDSAGVLAPLTLVEGGEISDADGLTYDTATILTSSLEGEIGNIGIRKRNSAGGSALEGRVKWRQIR